MDGWEVRVVGKVGRERERERERERGGGKKGRGVCVNLLIWSKQFKNFNRIS